MSRYAPDIAKIYTDIDVIWTPSPEIIFFWLFIYVYICLYLAAFVYITSTDMSRFVHTHILLISVYIAYALIYTDIDRYEHVWEIYKQAAVTGLPWLLYCCWLLLTVAALTARSEWCAQIRTYKQIQTYWQI